MRVSLANSPKTSFGESPSLPDRPGLLIPR